MGVVDDMESVIIISTEENKRKILRENSMNHQLCNLKFYTFQELKKKLFFDYDLTAILYIVQNCHVCIPIAKIYLENLYFLKDLDHEKIKFLNRLKQDLDKHAYLLYDKSFREKLKGKKVILYDYPVLTKEQTMILEAMDVPIENEKVNTRHFVPDVYEAKDMKEEVQFVVNEIAKLLEKQIPINRIKVVASSEYENLLARSFSFYQIPFNKRDRHSYYSTALAQDFLKHYEEYSIEENIMHLSEKYQNVNELIRIINRSVMILDKQERKAFIIEDLKQAKIKEPSYDQAVEIVDFRVAFEEEDHVFLLGFNVNEYPKIERDISYLSDKVKEELGLDTSMDLNSYEIQTLIHKIQQIKKLVITYKLNGPRGECYPSMLLDKLEIHKKELVIDHSVSYSKLDSEMKYAELMDDLYKFNYVDSNLAMYQKYLTIPYFQYDNQFTGISKTLLGKKLDHSLVLSYTNLEMYQECAFHYYVSKILRLDIFEENFKTILGSILHHILELGIVRDIDIPVEIMKFIKENDYVLNAKELFYLEVFSQELMKVLEVIRMQQSHSKLKHYLFEQEFFVYKDRENFKLTFKGNIDKVMYETFRDKEVIAVVDYKTGNTNITLKNLEYGLNIQLPIYLYLLKKSERFQHALIAGFYIQKVIPKKEVISFKEKEQDRLKARLRLQGFTNRDESLMEMIDDDYLNGKILANLQFKKDGTLSSKSKVLSNEEMDALIEKVDSIIDQVIYQILDGMFFINPKVIQDKNVSCTYCKFRDLCYKSKNNEVVLGGEEDGLDQGAEACY